MQADWAYAKRLAICSEELGYDFTLIAELNLNDIKDIKVSSLDAWSTTAFYFTTGQLYRPPLAVKTKRMTDICRGVIYHA